jgi:hypothetical protein
LGRSTGGRMGMVTTAEVGAGAGAGSGRAEPRVAMFARRMMTGVNFILIKVLLSRYCFQGM